MKPEKVMATFNGQNYTVADLRLEVAGDTDVGKLMVQKFVELASSAT